MRKLRLNLYSCEYCGYIMQSEGEVPSDCPACLQTTKLQEDGGYKKAYGDLKKSVERDTTTSEPLEEFKKEDV